MTNDEFIKQAQPNTTDHGYGCGDCYHNDEAHWGSGSGASTGSGRTDVVRVLRALLDGRVSKHVWR